MDIARATPLHLAAKFIRELAELILTEVVVPEISNNEHEVKISAENGTIYIRWHNPHAEPKGSYYLTIHGPTKNLRTPQIVWYATPDHPLWILLDDLYVQARFYAEIGQHDLSQHLLADVYLDVIGKKLDQIS